MKNIFNLTKTYFPPLSTKANSRPGKSRSCGQAESFFPEFPIGIMSPGGSEQPPFGPSQKRPPEAWFYFSLDKLFSST